MMNIFNSAVITLAAQTADAKIMSDLPLSERLSIGLELTLLGMGTVFAILIILWVMLELFRVIFYTVPNKRKKPTETNAVADNDAVAAAETTGSCSDSADETKSGALIAAITTAISVYTGQPQSSFRVVSFRRTGNKK